VAAAEAVAAAAEVAEGAAAAEEPVPAEEGALELLALPLGCPPLPGRPRGGRSSQGGDRRGRSTSAWPSALSDLSLSTKLAHDVEVLGRCVRSHHTRL